MNCATGLLFVTNFKLSNCTYLRYQACQKFH